MGRVWIDIGAHEGVKTREQARKNPALTVYAFEPNLEKAAALAKIGPNYKVIPCAVGCGRRFADFHLTSRSVCHSLLPIDPGAAKEWNIKGAPLVQTGKTLVPVCRLDEFFADVGLTEVEFMKVDAQGGDLDVLKSAGASLRIVKSLIVEAAVKRPMYVGGCIKSEIIAYLNSYGYAMTEAKSNTGVHEENLTFVRK